MEIRNMSQFKKVIEQGQCFRILKHHIHPELEGQVRKPNVIQTNGFYSIVPGEPDNPVSNANGGKGYWLNYGKASDWSFNNGTCKMRCQGKDIWEISFL